MVLKMAKSFLILDCHELFLSDSHNINLLMHKFGQTINIWIDKNPENR